MAAIGRHGSHVACFHDDPGERLPCVFMRAIPIDGIAHLKEPLNPVVGMQDRKNVFFCCRTHVAVLDHTGERGIPSHL